VLGRVDTIGVVQELIDSYSAKFSPYLTSDSLTAATIQYFLRKVLQHIETIGPIQNASVSKVYRDIVSHIKKADAVSHHALEIENLSQWPQAFKEIVNIASSNQSALEATSSKSTSHKRLKLFSGPFGDSLSSVHQLRQFCQRFSGLAELVRMDQAPVYKWG
jgi:hypothetical protein